MLWDCASHAFGSLSGTWNIENRGKRNPKIVQTNIIIGGSPGIVKGASCLI